MDLEARLQVLPDKPGVYLMKDEGGKIIYVGKATSLKQRVRSYFQKNRHHTIKELSLIARIHDLETIIVDSPVEALILECNLIKQYRPKYNIVFRDDKHYPYIKINLNESFPRIQVVRKVKADQARYFGPYTSTGAMNQTLKVIRDIFPLRSCSQEILSPKKRACLNAHIGRCAAPCVGKISQLEYGEMIDQVILFLEGRRREIIRDLETKMAQAAADLRFEEAGRLRDQIQGVRQVVAKQKIEEHDFADRDVVGLAVNEDLAVAQVFFVRSGKVIGREHFFLLHVEEEEIEDLLAAFLQQFYAQREELPGEIIVQAELSSDTLISQWLTWKKGKKVKIHRPQRGDKKRLLDLVIRNGEILLQQHLDLKERRKLEAGLALEELGQKLNLAKTPHRIECYDVSHIQGSNTVGSMVVFLGGKASPVNYRRFRIKNITGSNDYASLQEVVRRRLRRGIKERTEIREGELALSKAKFAEFADLLLIDGGKGQLSAVKEVVKELGLSIPLCALAEKFEHLFLPGEKNPIMLPVNSPAYNLIKQVRDEAHRFALTYHQKLRGKEQVKSVLDEIPGVGPARRKALLEAYGTVAEIKKVGWEELSLVAGMNQNVAKEVYKFFHHPEEGEINGL